MNYYLNNELVNSVNLIAEIDIPKISIMTMFGQISEQWFNLLR